MRAAVTPLPTPASRGLLERITAASVVRTVVSLYLLALAVRVVLIALFPWPAYVDSFYYVDVAQALRAGHGFNIDFIWVFVDVGGRLPAHPELPIPSNAHWMPLASLVQVPFLSVFGDNPYASAAPFAILGALAAPLTWAIARDAGARPSIQLGAGILAAVPAMSTVFMTQPDNFALFQPLVAGALWLTARGLKGKPWSFAIAGLLVGLATLARNDGVLVGGVVGLAFLWDRWRAFRSDGRRLPRIPLWSAVACVVLFAVVMVPWYVRQLEVFGSLSPSSSSGRILFVRSMADMNSVVADVSLQAFLGQGLASLIQSRVLGLVAAIGIYSVLIGSIVLVPFMLIGGWLRRRSVDFGPFFVYAAVFFAFSALISAIHVPGGTFIHSAVALAPGSYILALEGVAASIGWIANRRRNWSASKAVPVFVSAAVAFGVITGLFYAGGVHEGWSVIRDHRLAVAAELDRLGAPMTDRLMTIDAGGYKYYTGRPGVVTVDDSIDVVQQVARAYDTRWLVLERDSIVRSLAPILEGGPRPAWIGAPVMTLPPPAGATDTTPALALYPVCTKADDTRCRPA